MKHKDWNNSYLQRTIWDLYLSAKEGKTLKELYREKYQSQVECPFGGVKDNENEWDTLNTIVNMLIDELGEEEAREWVESVNKEEWK